MERADGADESVAGGIGRPDAPSRVPVPAMVLGYAGLLPPLAGIAARAAEIADGRGSGPVTPLLLVGGLLYGALILSFLGGMWWGAAAAKREGPALRRWLTLSVMPSLVALLCLLASGFNARGGGALLALALAITPLVDRSLSAEGLVPAWWMRLRVPLTFGLAAEMLAIAMLA